ncbi:MAG TPA: hypothetical protein VJ870_09460 [Amycolatopsis sp.]|nr:hypothetical protein [Amycolatopsis sp.]
MLEADGGGAATQAAYDVWGSGVVGGAQVGAAVAAAGGGGFEFPSIDEMNSVKGMWQDRQTSITKKQSQIRSALSSLSQLAADPESQGYLQQVRDSLTLLNNQHDSMLDYIENYIQKLTDAINAKHTNEEANQQAFRGASGSTTT